MRSILLIFFTFLVFSAVCWAQEHDVSAISKKLANPVSDIKNLPLRYDFDGGYDDNGMKQTLRIQPIFAGAINDEWSFLSRTVIPIVDQTNVVYLPRPGGGRIETQAGISDLQESIFITTKTAGGVTMGFGPIINIPSFYEGLSTNKLSVGPTGILLYDPGKWTVGVLANHLWSVAGGGPIDKGYFSQTMVQPLVTYQVGRGFSVGMNAESFYDWKTEDLTIPLTLTMAQVFVVKKMPVSLTVAPKYFVAHPDNGPTWGIRSVLTFVL